MRIRGAFARGEAGESLLEIIITIMIIGLAIPAVVGAVLAAIGSSSQDRRQVQAQQLLTSWSETIAKHNDDGSYTACPATSYYATGTFAPAAVPAGFAVSVASIDYWDTATSTFAGCAADKGIRRLRLRVNVDAGLYPSFAMDRYVIVRKPCLSC
jgi:type II secretory pathway pseudopilin PulG